MSAGGGGAGGAAEAPPPMTEADIVAAIEVEEARLQSRLAELRGEAARSIRPFAALTGLHA